MSYIIVCYQIDKYETLIPLSRTWKEKKFRIDSLIYYKTLLQQYQN